MFKSKIKDLIITQYEHGRLAGIFAALWGNKTFDKPDFDFNLFIQGVTLHDWHYGLIDNVAIGQASELEWLTMVHKGVKLEFDDPITDIIAKLHLKRLLSGHQSSQIAPLINQIEARIANCLAQTPVTRSQFEWADTITNFCDMLAFDVSFQNITEQQPKTRTLQVNAKLNTTQQIAITYKIKADGQISVNPWPFSVNTYSGFIIGYQQTDYPDTLKPDVIHFQLYNPMP